MKPFFVLALLFVSLLPGVAWGAWDAGGNTPTDPELLAQNAEQPKPVEPLADTTREGQQRMPNNG